MCFYFQKPEIRYIEKPDGVQPSPYAQYGMPQDFVDLTTGSDPYKLMDLLQLVGLYHRGIHLPNVLILLLYCSIKCGVYIEM